MPWVSEVEAAGNLVKGGPDAEDIAKSKEVNLETLQFELIPLDNLVEGHQNLYF